MLLVRLDNLAVSSRPALPLGFTSSARRAASHAGPAPRTKAHPGGEHNGVRSLHHLRYLARHRSLLRDRLALDLLYFQNRQYRENLRRFSRKGSATGLETPRSRLSGFKMPEGRNLRPTPGGQRAGKTPPAFQLAAFSELKIWSEVRRRKR